MTTEVFTRPEYKTVGKRPVRHDGVDKLTGKALYGADMRLPGLLHGKLLRSPHAHARIKSIDTSRAEAHPQIMAVATHRDLPNVEDLLADVGEDQVMSLKYASNQTLAEDKVLYKGHAVAAVAASSPHFAEEALDLIDVEYDVLPSVTNVEDAMKPDAPVLHEHLIAPPGFGEEMPSGTNVAGHIQNSMGDVEKGFEEADLVVEREFRTKTVHQGYIEPHTATAWWGPDERLTVWCSSQGQFGIRDQISKVLDMPVSEIKVVPMEIGGGFGGKLRAYLEPIAAVLSRKAARPVKLTMSRADVLEATGPTSGSYVKAKMAVTNDGRITAAQAYIVFEGGAYPGSSHGGAATSFFALYDIENVLTDGFDVVDNKPSSAAYRAPGAPIGTFAGESLVDEICDRLGMDPVEFRLLNAATEGTRMANGMAHPNIGANELLEQVKSHPHYSSPVAGKYRGRGFALGSWGNGAGPASVVANVHSNGKVSLLEGSVDIGGTRTVIAQQFAEVLGIPVEDVSPQVGDTDTIGYTSNTGGSGVAFKSGWAAHDAAQDIKRQLIERAAIVWETDAENVEYVDGVLQHKADPELNISFKELAGMGNETGGPIVGRASITPTGAARAFAANLVDVEVDPETGKVDILRYTTFQDAGVAIHPSYVEGQMQGGVAQGVGWALNEEYFMDDDGNMMNTSLLDYRMPISLDLPMIDAVIVEVFNPNHPYGVRGAGEAPLVPPLAAIANAVNDALGTRLTELPMSPPKILEALSKANGE